MLNNIDLSKYNVHTDLAIDNINLLNEHIKTIEEINDNVKVTKINLDDIESKKINKKKGIYTTIEFKDITDFQNREIVGKTLQTEIEKILNSVKNNKEQNYKEVCFKEEFNLSNITDKNE